MKDHEARELANTIRDKLLNTPVTVYPSGKYILIPKQRLRTWIASAIAEWREK